MQLVRSMDALLLFLAVSEAFEVALFWMVVLISRDYKLPEPPSFVTMTQS